MVRINSRPRDSYRDVNLKGIFFAGIIFLVLAVSFNCSTANEEIGKVKIKAEEVLFSKWEEIFDQHDVIPLRSDQPDFELFSIGRVSINSRGEYFILDGKVRKIMQFDSSGKFIRYIGRTGEGPGEYVLPGMLTNNKDDDLYLYDIGKRRINRYISPDYKYDENQIRIKKPIQDFFLTKDSSFITYTVSGNKVLHKLDAAGDAIKKYYKPKHKRLHLFQARFQLGRISEIPGSGFLFIYPAEYQVYFLDYNFQVKKWLFAEPGEYFPYIDKFPNDLSTYNFSPIHANWWSKWLHPGYIYYLGNNCFLVKLIRYRNLSERYYVNVHDFNGRTYAKGLEVPFNGFILYSKGGYIYIVEESSFNEAGEILPIKLHRYKFKEDILIKEQQQ